MSKQIAKTTKYKVDQYSLLYPLLKSSYNEIKELSKKKQDGILNKFKVGLINKLLIQIKEVLKDEPSFEYLDILSDEDLPSNSDAVLILSQFVSAMEQFEEKYFIKSDPDILWSEAVWQTED